MPKEKSKTRYLIQRNGSFYARVKVPKALQPLIGKTELSAPLNAAGQREAVRVLEMAVAPLKAQIEAARARTVADEQRVAPRRGKPLTFHELAQAHYGRQLSMDSEIRASDPRYAGMSADPARIGGLKEAVKGAATDQELNALVGPFVRAYQHSGNVTAEFGTMEWRQAAMAIAAAELESEARTAERDDGDFGGRPTHPLLTDAPKVIVPKDDLSARAIGPDSMKTLSELLPAYVAERRATGRTDYDSSITLRMLDEHLGETRPVYRLTKADINGFKRALAETPTNYTKRFPGLALPEAIKANKTRATPFPLLTAKTINEKYLSKLHAILNWCCKNDIIPSNPATGVKVASVAGMTTPPRVAFAPGDLSLIFDSKRFDTSKPLTEAQWAMLISLFAGHRASELAQTKLDSIRTERGVLVFAIEEETKTIGSQRIVPVHSTLLDLKLENYVKALRSKGATHLFPEWYRKGMAAKHEAESDEGAALLNHYFPRFIPKRFNDTYRDQVGIFDKRKTWHSFRHTFKTGLNRAGVDRGLNDALCGHSDDSAGGAYIHGYAVEAMKEAIEKLRFDGFALC